MVQESMLLMNSLIEGRLLLKFYQTMHRTSRVFTGLDT